MSLEVDIRLRRGAFTLAAKFHASLDGVTVLFGPSGAGKSLLLSALAGLARIDHGRIVFAGRVLEESESRIHVAPHQRQLGLVFQDTRLFPHLTVRGNLDFAARRAPAKLTIADATRLFDIDHLLDRPVRNLSGGEKSRVALARALLSAPDLLLLDEPFAALDGVRRRAFLHTLRKLHAQYDLPMLVVTHVIDEAAMLGDELIALSAGQVVAAGPLREAAATPAFQALLTLEDIGAAIAGNGAAAASVWLRADQVILASERPIGLSTPQIWEGEIASVSTAPDGTSLVRINTSAGFLLARTSPLAAFPLRPGARVWAIAQTHALG